MSDLVRASPAGALAERARVYIDANVTDKTRDDYAYDWRSFEAWCRERFIDPLTVDDGVVAVYLAWMADQGFAPRSIERAWHGVYTRLDQAKGEMCRKVLRGIRRTSTYRTKEKSPLLASDLARLLEHVGEGPLRLRNRALLLVGFAGGFRKSEIVALSRGDLTFTPQGLRVRLVRSKTDQERKQEKGIARGKEPLCPVAALASWLEHMARWQPVTDDAPVFPAMHQHGHIYARRLGAQSVVLLIKGACERAGLDVESYSAHSLRAGFVTQAAIMRKPLDAIMRQTGHRSLAQVLAYIRHATVFSENASEGIFG